MKSLKSFVHQSICRYQASAQPMSWSKPEAGTLGVNEVRGFHSDRISDCNFANIFPS